MTGGVPKISVLMAVYNCPSQYLELAITSVLTQSYEDFEFIIVDDGSNEPTRIQLRLHADRDPRIRLIPLKGNVGLTRALNVGLKSARGEFIARQDADDISMPNRFMATMMFLEADRGLAAAGTYVRKMGVEGEDLDAPQIEPDLRLLERRNVLVHGSMIFRKECLDRIGGYNEVMRLAQDYEVYLRMIRMNGMRLGVVPAPLYLLRQHGGSLSSRRMFRQFYFSVLAKTLTLPPRCSLCRKLVFLKILVFDFLITHRMLLGPFARIVLSAVRRK